MLKLPEGDIQRERSCRKEVRSWELPLKKKKNPAASHTHRFPPSSSSSLQRQEKCVCVPDRTHLPSRVPPPLQAASSVFCPPAAERRGSRAGGGTTRPFNFTEPSTGGLEKWMWSFRDAGWGVGGKPGNTFTFKIKVAISAQLILEVVLWSNFYLFLFLEIYFKHIFKKKKTSNQRGQGKHVHTK